MKRFILSLAILLFCSSANAVSIQSLEITGGTFLSGGELLQINPAALANMSIDGSTYHGSAPTGPGTEASYYDSSIATASHSLLGAISFFTAADIGLFGLSFPAPSGSVDLNTSTLNLDLSALSFYYSALGDSHNIGSSSDLVGDESCNTFSCTTPIITTYDALTNQFTASWTSIIDHGSLPGTAHDIQITGFVTTVPVPAAFWLFLSGALCLLGATRREKGTGLFN